MYHHRCNGCGGSNCSSNMLLRLSTVSVQVADLEAEYDLDPKTVAELTGLEKDVPIKVGDMQLVYRGGTPFEFR